MGLLLSMRGLVIEELSTFALMTIRSWSMPISKILRKIVKLMILLLLARMSKILSITEDLQIQRL